MNTVISFIGLVVVYAIAYGFDRLDTLVLRHARENFNLSSYYLFLSVVNLIHAALLLVLAWSACFRKNKRWLVALVFITVGLFGTFTYTAAHGIPFFAAPNSRVAYASAFVAIIGIARLFFKNND